MLILFCVWQEAVKVLKSRVLEAIKVAKINQEDCERLRGQLAESEKAQQVLVSPQVCVIQVVHFLRQF